jgi:hypothetical protein
MDEQGCSFPQSLAGYMKLLARYYDGMMGMDAGWIAAIGTGVPARGPIATGAEYLHVNYVFITP